MTQKLSESENLKFFQEDAASDKKTSYISRLVMLTHYSRIRNNFKSTLLLTIVFAVVLAALNFAIPKFYNSIKDNYRISELNFVNYKKDFVEKYPIDKFNEVFEKGLYLHEFALYEHYELLSVVDEADAKSMNLYSDKRNAEGLNYTQEKLSKIKNYLYRTYTSDKMSDFINYSQSDWLTYRTRFLEMMNGEYSSDVMGDDYHNIIAKNNQLKIILKQKKKYESVKLVLFPEFLEKRLAKEKKVKSEEDKKFFSGLLFYNYSPESPSPKP